MTSHKLNISQKEVPKYERGFFSSGETISVLGDGEIGGKASGLVSFQSLLETKVDASQYPSIQIKIPKFVVISTDHFDHFMGKNDLYETALSDLSDERKAKIFLAAEIPTDILGDLRSISTSIHIPLAIRSSSMLEDSLEQPFAGVYATKMIGNHEPNPDKRFKKLVEALKFVYASTFFKSALQYFEATGNDPRNEKMAVIIQEVIGTNRNKRFYPAISGVARSHNYYPFGRSKSEDGIVNLALGLGKTIVDGGVSWIYNPKYPKITLPFASPKELIKSTQSKFFAVNMNPLITSNPLTESEYLVELDLADADYDSALDYSASTFSEASNKLTMGIGSDGARVIDFARLLKLNEFNFNKLIIDVLQTCDAAFKMPIEIEFAFDIVKRENRVEFALLQVRPMNVSKNVIDFGEGDAESDKLLVKSKQVLGNGEDTSVNNIIFVDPNKFESKFTKSIAQEIEIFNKKFVDSKTDYVLVGFGRWGSSDEWLGIPVNWGQVSRAKVIVESGLPNFNIDFSQGSHFFHNITAFDVYYYSVKYESNDFINWDWLLQQKVESQTDFVKHVRLDSPLKIKVDGRIGLGIISYG